jgi:carbamoyl-phosphate synthase small subunit
MMDIRKKGYLVLATGRVFEGQLFGAPPNDRSFGEVVFNTSMTGYQEILTDPSYEGQIVVMTPSHVGNYGINPDDVESGKIYLSGFVVQELSTISSNWRSQKTLDQYLSENGITGLTGVDTRALTRHLRTLGAVNGLLISETTEMDKWVQKAKLLPSMEGQDLVKHVTTKSSYLWTKGSTNWDGTTTPTLQGKNRKNVVVIDYGVKQNILRCLVDRKCNVTVVPATMTADEILSLKPDGIMLSNGPGDPAAVEYGIKTVKELFQNNLKRVEKGETPFAIFGICLGHQILSLALDAETFKLKFGHHGANHPIKELHGKKIDITTQNHGFAVKGEKDEKGNWAIKNTSTVIPTHININDYSIAGICHKSLPMASVQYHPEASAGPHDANHLFDRFIDMMETN